MTYFCKLHGLGNDFMVLDGTQTTYSFSPELIRALSCRHTGVGFDQLLLLEPAKDGASDFFWRIYNADGSESGQCGNGARAMAVFIRHRGLSTKTSLILQSITTSQTLSWTAHGFIQVDMPVPEIREHVKDPLSAKEASVIFIGNPHAVVSVKDISAPIENLARAFQSHPRFPDSVNVGFMRIRDRHHVQLRVYERGAGETLGCGSGACAAVVAGRFSHQLDNPVDVHLPGGTLTVSWEGIGHHVQLTGPAAIVYEGEIDLTQFNHTVKTR